MRCRSHRRCRRPPRRPRARWPHGQPCAPQPWHVPVQRRDHRQAAARPAARCRATISASPSGSVRKVFNVTRSRSLVATPSGICGSCGPRAREPTRHLLARSPRAAGLTSSPRALRPNRDATRTPRPAESRDPEPAYRESPDPEGSTPTPTADEPPERCHRTHPIGRRPDRGFPDSTGFPDRSFPELDGLPGPWRARPDARRLPRAGRPTELDDSRARLRRTAPLDEERPDPPALLGRRSPCPACPPESFWSLRSILFLSRCSLSMIAQRRRVSTGDPVRRAQPVQEMAPATRIEPRPESDRRSQTLKSKKGRPTRDGPF